jgi:hypothetical protein
MQVNVNLNINLHIYKCMYIHIQTCSWRLFGSYDSQNKSKIKQALQTFSPPHLQRMVLIKIKICIHVYIHVFIHMYIYIYTYICLICINIPTRILYIQGYRNVTVQNSLLCRSLEVILPPHVVVPFTAAWWLYPPWLTKGPLPRLKLMLNKVKSGRKLSVSLLAYS